MEAKPRKKSFTPREGKKTSFKSKGNFFLHHYFLYYAVRSQPKLHIQVCSVIVKNPQYNRANVTLTKSQTTDIFLQCINMSAHLHKVNLEENHKANGHSNLTTQTKQRVLKNQVEMEDQRNSTENQQTDSSQRKENTLEIEANRRKVQMSKYFYDCFTWLGIAVTVL